MTASEILNIVTTVATTQAFCDLAARWLVFSRPAYKRSVDELKRAQTKRDKLVASLDTPAKKEKQAKKLQRLDEDCAETASEVARKHMLPTFLTSLVFLILFRILGTEYSGEIMCVLPFEPFSLLRRVTQRGLDIDKTDPNMNRACSYLFIYILSTISVKYFVHKLVGAAPPKGADGGLATMLESPKNQRVMRSLGVDTDLLKTS